MAGMDYCYWRGERCRYVDDDTAWDCEFHRALAAGDVEAMRRSLLDRESRRPPAGVAVESVVRREDGAYVFTVVALPSDEHDHPILETLQPARTPS